MCLSPFTARRAVILSMLSLALAAAQGFARPAYPGYAPGYFSGAPVGHYGGSYGGYRPGYFSDYRSSYPAYQPWYGNDHTSWSYAAPMPYTAPWAYFSAGGGEEVVGDTVISGRYVPPPPANPAPAPVTVNVHVPESAEVWFDDYQTDRTGAWRTFQSQPVRPGRDYFYTVRARWTENGQVVEQSRRVKVHADEETTIDFTRPARDATVPR